MNFGQALDALKMGFCVARRGWNGKGMWLALIPAGDWLCQLHGVALGLPKLPWIGMRTADEHFVPWLASQTDILAEDWEVAT